MRIKHIENAAGSLAHDGDTFTPDEGGVFDVPFELAQNLLRFPIWTLSEEPVLYVAPEPAPKEPATNPAGTSTTDTETKAAEAATAAAEKAKPTK